MHTLSILQVRLVAGGTSRPVTSPSPLLGAPVPLGPPRDYSDRDV